MGKHGDGDDDGDGDDKDDGDDAGDGDDGGDGDEDGDGEAMRLVMEGSPLCAAMKQAWCDPVVKERNFTTPIALAPRQGLQERPQSSEPPLKQQKGKGKGTEKKSMPLANCAGATPDGGRRSATGSATRS